MPAAFPRPELINPDVVKRNVAAALAEDLGPSRQDVTGELIARTQKACGRIITRQPMVLCGKFWVDETFAQVSPDIALEWCATEAEILPANSTILRLSGPARAILTAERTALNFLQCLSATATTTHHLAAQIAAYPTALLDTRKTLPGLRLAQKYAVRCGGGSNHRIGLFDRFLVKENHIIACGNIGAAVATARRLQPHLLVEVEVESHAELEQALQAGADIILLDNFSLADTQHAVVHTAGRARLEASGNMDEKTLLAYAKTGVDYISMGALTKNIQAIDLSLRLDPVPR